MSSFLFQLLHSIVTQRRQWMQSCPSLLSYHLRCAEISWLSLLGSPHSSQPCPMHELPNYSLKWNKVLIPPTSNDKELSPLVLRGLRKSGAQAERYGMIKKAFMNKWIDLSEVEESSEFWSCLRTGLLPPAFSVTWCSGLYQTVVLKTLIKYFRLY